MVIGEVALAKTTRLEQGEAAHHHKECQADAYLGNHSCWFSGLLVSASGLTVFRCSMLSTSHPCTWVLDCLARRYPSFLPLCWKTSLNPFSLDFLRCHPVRGWHGLSYVKLSITSLAWIDGSEFEGLSNFKALFHTTHIIRNLKSA